MKTLIRVVDFVLFVCGAYLTAFGCIGIFLVDPDGADFMKCQLFAIQGLVMLICARI